MNEEQKNNNNEKEIINIKTGMSSLKKLTLSPINSSNSVCNHKKNLSINSQGDSTRIVSDIFSGRQNISNIKNIIANNSSNNNSINKDGALITELPIQSSTIENIGPDKTQEILTSNNETVLVKENIEENKNVQNKGMNSIEYNYIDKHPFVPFPIISRSSDRFGGNSLLFLINHPERPINRQKKINFNENPGLFKGRILCRNQPKVLRSYYNLSVKFPQFSLQKLHSILNQDFNKLNLYDKNRYRWNKPHYKEDIIKEEIENRNIFKYKDKRLKKIIRKNNYDDDNNNNQLNNENIKSSREIIKENFPNIKGIRYQKMISNKLPPIINKNAKIVDIK